MCVYIYISLLGFFPVKLQNVIHVYDEHVEIHSSQFLWFFLTNVILFSPLYISPDFFFPGLQDGQLF